MTVHHLPAEPAVDTVWTVEGDGPTPVVYRWDRRAGLDSTTAWKRPDVEDWRARTWVELLQRGAVCDTHPDLPADHPFPWTVRYDDEDIPHVDDARGWRVRLDDDEVVGTVVKAANAYAERLLDGELPPAPTGLPPALAYALRELVDAWGVLPGPRRDVPDSLVEILDKVAARYRNQQAIVRATEAAR